MRTTLNIDDQALSEALKAAEGKTKTAVINEALREYARRRRVRRLLAFRGRRPGRGISTGCADGRRVSCGSSSTRRSGPTS